MRNCLVLSWAGITARVPKRQANSLVIIFEGLITLNSASVAV